MANGNSVIYSYIYPGIHISLLSSLPHLWIGNSALLSQPFCQELAPPESLKQVYSWASQHSPSVSTHVCWSKLHLHWWKGMYGWEKLILRGVWRRVNTGWEGVEAEDDREERVPQTWGQRGRKREKDNMQRGCERREGREGQVHWADSAWEGGVSVRYNILRVHRKGNICQMPGGVYLVNSAIYHMKCDQHASNHAYKAKI